MADNIRSKASERYTQARDKAGNVLSTSRAKAGEALKASKARVRDSKAAAAERARLAREKAAEQMESNPLAAVAGGLAVGAIIAALLPRTARENRLVGPVSRSVKATARTAAKVAGNVAKVELIALGVSQDAARQQVRELASKIGKAATSAGSAAAKTVRKDT